MTYQPGKEHGQQHHLKRWLCLCPLCLLFPPSNNEGYTMTNLAAFFPWPPLEKETSGRFIGIAPNINMGTMCCDLKRWFYDEMPTFAHPISMQVSGRRYFLARLTWWLHRYNMQPCTRCPWAKLWDGSVGSSMKKFGSSEGEHGGFWLGIFRPQQIHGIPKWLTMECLTLMALTVGSSKAPSK